MVIVETVIVLQSTRNKPDIRCFMLIDFLSQFSVKSFFPGVVGEKYHSQIMYFTKIIIFS